jgi:hypothetical protein
MKLHRLHIVFVALSMQFFFASCDTSGNVESPEENFFLKMYGEDGDQRGVDLIILGDGSALLLGNTQTDDMTRIYLVKVDQYGNKVWEKKYGEKDKVTVAKDIEPMAGGFAILATVQTQTRGTDAKLIRINESGIAMDSVLYGYDQNDDAQSLTPLLDNGFIITGSTTRDTTKQDPQNPQIDPNAYSNIFHYRCNSTLSFDQNWYELYGALGKFDFGTKVIQNASNRFYVFGYSDLSNQSGKMNLQYYSLSAEGIPSNNVSLLGDINFDTRSSFVCEIPTELGGGILLIGTTNRAPGDFSLHVSTLKTPLRFNPGDDEGIDAEILIGTARLQAVSAAPSLHQTSGYLLLANEERTLGTNIWLTKIDQSGRVLWSASLGSERENDTAAAVKELPDGKILVLGTVGIADNQTKMALFKLNSSGRLQE